MILNMRSFLIILFAITYLCAVPVTGLAQNANVTDKNAEDQVVYHPLTFQNLINLYWVMGKIEGYPDKYLDSYLRVTECSIYKRFYENDVEWEKIQDATVNHLKNLKETFGQRIYFTIPLKLERYNADKQAFELTRNTMMVEMRRLHLDIENVVPREICEKRGVGFTQLYPFKLILDLDSELDLREISLDEEDAEKLVNSQTFKENERTLFLKLYARLISYQKEDSKQHTGASLFWAQIEKADLFLDRNLIKPVIRDVEVTPREVKIRLVPK